MSEFLTVKFAFYRILQLYFVRILSIKRKNSD